MDTQGIEVVKRGNKYWVENPTNSYDDSMVKLRTARMKFKQGLEKLKQTDHKHV